MPSTGRPRPAAATTSVMIGARLAIAPRAQVVAVGEAAGHDHGVDPAQVVVGVPQRNRGAARQPDRARGVAVVERAGERDDADLHGAALTTERRVLTTS
jgi:hypothetical protein